MGRDLYLWGMTPADTKLAARAERVILALNPSIIGVEETQQRIDELMLHAARYTFAERMSAELVRSYPDANRETVRMIAGAERDFYKLLARRKRTHDKTVGEFGARIAGCDSPDFPESQYRDAINEYNARKNTFLEEILCLPPAEAEREIQKNYGRIPRISNSRALAEYYEARDSDTAKLIAREMEASDLLGGRRSFVYFCGISHFEPHYNNLFLKLEDMNLDPHKCRLSDADILKLVP